jgi:hypothetical protein
MASTAPAPRHRRRAEGQAEGKGETRRRGGRRLLVRGFAAVVVVAAAVTFGSALSRVDHASTAAPLPGASSPVRSPSPSTAETAGRGPDWRQVLVALDARRSEAFARGESLALARVYAAGSRPLARDTEALRRLVAAGVTAPGLRLEVSQVRPLSVEPRRALLSVVDRLPAHDLIARDGTVREHRPGRGPQAWQITVVPAPGRPAGEWRIAAVERVLS